MEGWKGGRKAGWMYGGWVGTRRIHFPTRHTSIDNIEKDN